MSATAFRYPSSLYGVATLNVSLQWNHQNKGILTHFQQKELHTFFMVDMHGIAKEVHVYYTPTFQ